MSGTPPEFPGPPSTRTRVPDDVSNRLAQGCVTAFGGVALFLFVLAGWLGGTWYLLTRLFGG